MAVVALARFGRWPTSAALVGRRSQSAIGDIVVCVAEAIRLAGGVRSFNGDDRLLTSEHLGEDIDGSWTQLYSAFAALVAAWESKAICIAARERSMPTATLPTPSLPILVRAKRRATTAPSSGCSWSALPCSRPAHLYSPDQGSWFMTVHREPP